MCRHSICLQGNGKSIDPLLTGAILGPDAARNRGQYTQMKMHDSQTVAVGDALHPG